MVYMSEDISTGDKILYIKSILYKVEGIMETAYKLLKSDKLTQEQRDNLEDSIDKAYDYYKKFEQDYLIKK